MKNVKKGIQSDQTVTSTPIAQADKTEQEKGRLWSERSSGHDESVELQKKLKLAPMEGTQLEKKQVDKPTTRSLVQRQGSHFFSDFIFKDFFRTSQDDICPS